VIAVFRDMFVQLTTTGTGLACCAEITASGMLRAPDGEAETATPAMLEILNCAPWPAAGTITGWNPWLKAP
jgi:hypothetical protein